MKIRRFSIFVLLSLLAPLFSGCTTHKLWSESTFDDWNEPSETPHLHIYQTKKDFLVVYDEYCERSDSTRRRAYLLQENKGLIERGARPRFVNANCASSLEPIPFFTNNETLPTNTACFAIGEADQKVFQLYRSEATNRWELPVYNDGKGKVERILLTPATVTADLTIIGGLVGIWYWQGISHAGMPLYWPQ